MKNQTFIYSFFIFLSVFLVYANTLTHQYALDDAIVISNNDFTKKGFDGIGKILSTDSFTGFFGEEKNLVEGGRYRPLSIVTFAVEYEFFGMNPWLSHFFNVVFYAFSCVMLYLVFVLLFQNTSLSNRRLLSLLPVLFFAFHPLHVEVVANIKGRDEILSFLGVLLAFYYALRYVVRDKVLYLFFVGLFMFVGLLSKENAIAFCAIIPFAIFLFHRNALNKIVPVAVSLFVPFVVFLLIRASVLNNSLQGAEISEILNNPFAGASAFEKYATVFYTWLRYLKLLVFPHPLTHDYYPYHIQLTNFSNPLVIISLVLHVALIFYALLYTFFFLQKKEIAVLHSYLVFAIFFYFSTFIIVSNLFFSIGVFMAERFMYMPSVGFCVAVGVGIYFLSLKVGVRVAVAFALVLMSVLLVKTVDRNRAWENDFVLFTTDVVTSGNSAKVTCSAGGKIMEEIEDWAQGPQKDMMYAKAKKYLNKSVKIHPRYVEALNLSGNCCYHMQQYDSAVYYYKKVVMLSPGYKNAYTNVLATIEKINDNALILETLHFFHEKNPNVYGLNYKLGHMYGRYKNDITQAIFYLTRAVAIDSNKSEAWKDLGVAYAFSNNLDNALKMFLKAYALNPNDNQLAMNIATAYTSNGQMDEAEKILVRLYEKNPKDVQVLMRLVTVYQSLGNGQRAQHYYSQAQLLKSENVKK